MKTHSLMTTDNELRHTCGMLRSAQRDGLSDVMRRRTAMSHQAPIEQLSINTIRTLSMDAVQAANSGHPGTPMAMAPVVYTLWQQFLRFDPDDPIWPNRDRFVLSMGHASLLLYSMLALAGVKAV